MRWGVSCWTISNWLFWTLYTTYLSDRKKKWFKQWSNSTKQFGKGLKVWYRYKSETLLFGGTVQTALRDTECLLRCYIWKEHIARVWSHGDIKWTQVGGYWGLNMKCPSQVRVLNVWSSAGNAILSICGTVRLSIMKLFNSCIADMCRCAPCVCGTHRVQKMKSSPMELELYMVVSPLGAGNQTSAPWKRSQSLNHWAISRAPV